MISLHVIKRDEIDKNWRCVNCTRVSNYASIAEAAMELGEYPCDRSSLPPDNAQNSQKDEHKSSEIPRANPAPTPRREPKKKKRKPTRRSGRKFTP